MEAFSLLALNDVESAFTNWIKAQYHHNDVDEAMAWGCIVH